MFSRQFVDEFVLYCRTDSKSPMKNGVYWCDACVELTNAEKKMLINLIAEEQLADIETAKNVLCWAGN